MSRSYFPDRAEAGQLLAKELERCRGTDAIVLAIPRGGVTVGHALAKELGLELFSRGGGSNLERPRNRWVAEELHRAFGSGHHPRGSGRGPALLHRPIPFVPSDPSHC